MDNLKIIKAIYYVPEIGLEKGTDVTEELSAEVVDDRLVYNGIYNFIFPDNFPGIVKRLKVEVEYQDKKYTKFYVENYKINLPYDLGLYADSSNRVALNLEKSAKNNIFINSKANGGVKVSGSDNKFVKTNINKSTISEKSETGWLGKYWWRLVIPIVVIVAGFIITEGKLPGIFSNTKTPTEITDSPNVNSDLRDSLIGYSTIFDLITKIRSLDIELNRQDLVRNNLSKSFVASSTMYQLGKLDDGEIYVTLEGQDLNGSNQYMECHFDKSWENTLRSLFDTENKKITFTGKIAFYKQGWLVAEDCEVLKY